MTTTTKPEPTKPIRKAWERWGKLTPPLTPFPRHCGHCTLVMRDDQEATVFESARGVPRAMHSKCYRMFGYKAERGAK